MVIVLPILVHKNVGVVFATPSQWPMKRTIIDKAMFLCVRFCTTFSYVEVKDENMKTESLNWDPLPNELEDQETFKAMAKSKTLAENLQCNLWSQTIEAFISQKSTHFLHD